MTPVTPAESPHTFRHEIEHLRGLASRDPTLATLKASLPEYRQDAVHGPGLYFDRAAAAGIRIGNDYRVSVARIWSVGPDGAQLVGQCQVTGTKTSAGTKWRVRWFVHAPDQFWSAAHDDVHAWWLQVLERHLERGGELPEIGGYVSA